MDNELMERFYHIICFRPGTNCHPERSEKDIVEMITPQILRDSTAVYRQPLKASLVNMLLNNV